MCIYTGCKVYPNYNVEGERKPLYCSKHKSDRMVNVISKTCIHPGCKVIPIYNLEGETKALYCSEHKLDGMVDVKNKKCIHPGCKVQPVYNLEGERKPLYCFAHKSDGMIDVISKKCIHPGCKVRPNYNVEGETKAIYCFAHKSDGMIDVKNKTCIHPGCKVQPNYNVEGEPRAIYCSEHKLDGMVNVVSKTCISEWCLTQVSEKYDGYCVFCYMNLFPDKPISRNYKTKEYSVVEYVKSKFTNVDWVADKTIRGGCSKRRPDLLLDLGYQIVIIEIDENQHINYGSNCETKRIMEISQDLGDRPIVFIRFNPDEYKTGKSTISSCWALNKKGICVIKKSKRNEWIQRLHVLEETINYWIHLSNLTNKTIETVQLFYDM